MIIHLFEEMVDVVMMELGDKSLVVELLSQKRLVWDHIFDGIVGQLIFSSLGEIWKDF